MGGKTYESIKRAGYEEKVVKNQLWLLKEFPNYIIAFEVFDVSEWDSVGLAYEVKTEIELKNENFISITMPKCTLSVNEVEKIIERIANDNSSTV